MEKTDWKDIKSSLDIVDEIGRYVHLKRAGKNLVGLCPFHDESTPSFNVNPKEQYYKCFGCGVGGDVIEFLEKYRGMTKKEIVDYANGSAITDTKPTYVKQILHDEPENELQQLPPLEPLVIESIYNRRLGKPVKVYIYHDADGKPYSAVCRFEQDGKKQVLPYSYCFNGSKYFWTWKGVDAPRLLYNLHNLIRNKRKAVIIVEGEKAADAAIQLFPDYVVTTWIGGSNGVPKADWAQLKGRKVYLCPDNDEPGYKAMNEIAYRLRELGCSVWWCEPPVDAKGWDWADWTGHAIKANTILERSFKYDFDI
mgnify:CR=1 FL=1